MTQDPDVKIVDLEALHVVAATGYGEHPEDEAWEKVMSFAKARGLEPWSGRHRFFGFNNPPPPECPPEYGCEYGYEQWMTVADLAEVDPPYVVKDVPGRTYAVAHCTGLENISASWKALARWVAEHGHQWLPDMPEGLEEVLTPIDRPFDEWEIDLYLPLAG